MSLETSLRLSNNKTYLMIKNTKIKCYITHYHLDLTPRFSYKQR